MKKNIRGFALALAWPQTYCKGPGAWYDAPADWFGFSRNGFYQVGHAAVVLIQAKGTCRYYDFGRYHAPFGHGRVRSGNTDPELTIHTRARFNYDGQLINATEILNEIAKNQASHGNGGLHAGLFRISVPSAEAFAYRLQQREFVPYGPFIRNGTNCSRFVRDLLLAGNPSLKTAIQLRLPRTLSPTPIFNVRNASQRFLVNTNVCVGVPGTVGKRSVLQEPTRSKGIPDNAKWLAGEGAGSWFHIHSDTPDQYIVTRYSPTGQVEFQASYNGSSSFDPSAGYQVTYPSHYLKVNVSQKLSKTTLFQSNPSVRESLVLLHQKSLRKPFEPLLVD